MVASITHFKDIVIYTYPPPPPSASESIYRSQLLFLLSPNIFFSELLDVFMLWIIEIHFITLSLREQGY